MYDKELDRYDVAVRAVIKLVRWARWDDLALVGINRRDHFDQIDEALLDIGYPVHEHQLFKLLKRCPFLVDAAVELLNLYWFACGESRRDYYRVAQ